MSTLDKFVGVIPYSLYEDEPVALIWRHCYTSPITKADASLYSELVIRKIDDEETSPQAISRILSKISKGAFIKTKNNNNNNTDQCYKKMLSLINKFKNVAILENNNGYKLYLIPVKFIKTKKLHNMIENNVYYKECHWISFNKLLSVIYEKNIQKMTVNNIENYKYKKNKTKKLTNYKLCRLSLQFSYVLRNSHFRVILPLFNELKLVLNDNVCQLQIQQMAQYDDIDNDDDDDDNDKLEESLIIRCKKCRIKLFNDLLISVHSLKTINTKCKENCIFLDSAKNKVIKLLNKMNNDSSSLKGILSCFKCKYKIGRYNFCGQQCPCTAFICPSFQISASKVDIHQINQGQTRNIKANQLVNISDIHLPKTQFINDAKDEKEEEEEKEARVVHIVHISDTHELYERFTDKIPYKKDAINILIHSGDFSPEGNGGMLVKPERDGMEQKVKAFGEWFRNLPHEKKVIIAGNHELELVNMTKQEIKKEIFNDDDSVIYLQDDMINLYGINIYGTPWNEKYKCLWGSFGADDDGMKEKWKLIPSDTDILVTHQPPFNEEIEWKVTSGGNADLWHQVINRIKPKAHLFGHLHGYNGHVFCKNVLFINSALKPPTEREIPSIPHQFDVIFDL